VGRDISVMIADSECDSIFVADTLERKFPKVFQSLVSILGEHAIPLRTIEGTLDVWCRDYLPVQVAEDRFVQFRYEPDYLDGRYHRLRADGKIGPKLPWLRECRRSRIVMDGGNVVRWGNRAIVTDKVFRENPDWGRKGLVEALKADLELDVLIVVPREPFDPIGHADGMVCWLGERTVLVNDYSTLGEAFRRRTRRCFHRSGVEIIELPYDPQRGGRGGMPTAAGNWMNFLRVRDVLIAPVFGMSGDDRALEILREVHPSYTVEALDCRELAEEGGLVHCLTWQARLNGER
jgi:agmatine deiminase